MPSVLVDARSGGTPVFAGNAFVSGLPFRRQDTGIYLLADPNNSGFLYLGFSGGVTIRSGGIPPAGGGGMDGIPYAPGQANWIPRLDQDMRLYAACDPAASGQGRLFYEVY